MAKKDSANSDAQRGAVDVADSPLLDLTDAAVKRMIKLAKKRGFVTYEELNAVLPSEEVNSEQIEGILAMLNDIGINVIENEELDDAANEESAIRGGGPPPTDSQSDKYVLYTKTFEAAVDRLGQIADELDCLAQSTTSAIAAIEAQGDRIDRLQADNRALLDDLQNGKW